MNTFDLKTPTYDATPNNVKGGHMAWLLNVAAGLENVPKEVAFYLADLHASITTDRSFNNSEVNTRIMDDMSQVAIQHGFAENNIPGAWDDPLFAPEEYAALQREWDAERRKATGEELRSMGRNAMADLLECDPDEYKRIEKIGKQWWETNHARAVTGEELIGALQTFRAAGLEDAFKDRNADKPEAGDDADGDE